MFQLVFMGSREGRVDTAFRASLLAVMAAGFPVLFASEQFDMRVAVWFQAIITAAIAGWVMGLVIHP